LKLKLFSKKPALKTAGSGNFMEKIKTLAYGFMRSILIDIKCKNYESGRSKRESNPYPNQNIEKAFGFAK
jgi:hypothetical protein